jgi:hypothetical protein
MWHYEQAFSRHGLRVGQVLLTGQDISDRSRYLNARNTLLTLLAFGVLPVINENDTVAIDEIKVGDNDNLSAWWPPHRRRPPGAHRRRRNLHGESGSPDAWLDTCWPSPRSSGWLDARQRRRVKHSCRSPKAAAASIPMIIGSGRGGPARPRLGGETVGTCASRADR